ASSGLSEEEIQRMVREAEAHAAEDKKARALIEARNEADASIHGARKALSEHATAPEAEKAKVNEAIAAVETAVKGEDVEAIKGAVATLVAAMSTLLQHAGASTAGDGAGASAGAGGQTKNDDVVEAEFEEVQDNKK
ncbi:MAG: Hsp70 family protein, partial [Clostridia bacterium]